MPRILIVEDDAEVMRMLRLELQKHHHEIVSCTNGLEALRKFHQVQPDLVVLDVMLPQMDGVTVCKRLREISDVPIVMMSAEAITEEDIVRGLEIGADEYVRKPLGWIEFPARVNALLRRSRLSNEEASDRSREPIRYSDGCLDVDSNTRRVLVNGEEQRLTPTEFKLLITFLRHQGQVLTFQQLLEQVWGYEYTTEHHYPRIYVSHLRRKIEPDHKNPTYIQNEYGVGYRFVAQ